MKNLLKKNQIVLFVIGLMVIAAGYLNFTNNNNSVETGALTDSEEMASIGDARLVSGEVVDANSIDTNSTIESNTNVNDVTNIVTNSVSENMTNGMIDAESANNTNTIDDSNQNMLEAENIVGNDIETNSQAVSTDEYFTNSKLERDAMYSQRIENYQNILNNTNVSEAQKKTAQEEITKINNEQNAIMIAENLIKTKGIEDLVIFVNGDSINVIVKGTELEKEEIAQIQNIITRELEADIRNIHIMNK